MREQNGFGGEEMSEYARLVEKAGGADEKRND